MKIKKNKGVPHLGYFRPSFSLEYLGPREESRPSSHYNNGYSEKVRRVGLVFLVYFGGFRILKSIFFSFEAF